MEHGQDAGTRRGLEKINPKLEGVSLLEVRITRWLDDSVAGYSSDPSQPAIYGITLQDLLSYAYQVTPAQIRGIEPQKNQRLGFKIVGARAEASQYDVLKAMVPAALGFRAEERTENTEVLVLRRREGAQHLRAGSGPEGVVGFEGQRMVAPNASMGAVAAALAPRLHLMVLDETGFRGRFHLTVTLSANTAWDSEQARRELAEQLGVSIERARRDVKFVDVRWPRPQGGQ
ncbi:MAG: DUF3738 domain-containing protein [Phycisphaerales bacterium]